MYLERIEMQGFKSFADKTVIEFDRGITAVVGPNGSGKSNLSEAIRWVLGEQSAKSVRASKMEDVIFNGTQDRPPVNMAKVTLVLNNEDRYLDYDFNEIQIARSYSRNGDSNYYINNQVVRLKDVVDLLLDSGLGKDSFSMISQGEVEQIFLNKPEERRAIFEEAAGVQKYQHRKHEASLKINRSQDHLNRVEDIIHELVGQLEPLKKQRDDALVWQDLSQELKENEVSLYKVQIDQYQGQWQTSKKELDQLNNHQAELEIELNQLIEKLNQTQFLDEELSYKIDANIVEYQEQIKDLERKKGQSQVLTQELNYQQTGQKERLANYQQQLVELESLKTKNQSLKDLLTGQLDQKSRLEAKISELEEELTSIQAGDENDIEDIRNQAITFYQEEARLNNQIKQNEKLIEVDQTRLNKLTQEIENSHKLIQSEEKIIQELQTNYQSHQNEFDHLQFSTQAQNQVINDHQIKREQAQDQLFQVERNIQQAQNQVDNLESMQESYAGYYAGVQAVMKAGLDGVEGTIAELIRVSEKYQTAIDTALGSSLQHIVVKDDSSARSAINYLKEKRAGRATFLPRTNIKSRYLDKNLLNSLQHTQGYIAVASQIVDYKAQDQAIVENLLGTTVVCDTMVNAQNLARQFNFRLRIVTLDGEILYPGGSISGGGKARQSTMLSQQTKLEKARRELSHYQKQKNELEEEILSYQDLIQTTRDQLKSYNQKLNKMAGMSQSFQDKINQHKQSIDNLNFTHQANQTEAVSLQEAIDLAKTEINKSLDQVKKVQDQIQKANDELANLNLNVEDRQKKINQLDELMRDLSTQLAVIKVEVDQTKTSLNDNQTNLEKLNAYITSYESTKDDEALSVDDVTNQIKELDHQIQSLAKSSQELDQTIKSDRSTRSEYKTTISELENSQAKLRNDIQTNYQQIAKLEAKIEKLESYIDNHLDYLNQEYQLSYEAAREIASDIQSTKQVQDYVKDLKRKINRLGPINLQAIEDYEELNDRYQKLSNQQNDLLTAISQLQETVKEMDNEVITRFGATFKEIDQQFQITFRQLFGGGSAQLQLTDPNNLLETGVDIIAQPPGKKRQNLALLSGGERALTALALLFAILEVRPTPFVVLDEVEAALDDANVYRYGEYLKNFSHETQFIVITHRKGTMEAADILYGVTMQDSGVSKMASVRLSDAEELID